MGMATPSISLVVSGDLACLGVIQGNSTGDLACLGVIQGNSTGPSMPWCDTGQQHRGRLALARAIGVIL